MNRSIRLAVVACAGFVALSFASPSFAVYQPRLTATATNHASGRPTTMILGHIQGADEDPTAKDTIYAPLGYQVNLTQPVGAKIGDVFATLILRGGGNAEVDVEGQVIADNPAAHPSDPCAPGLHQAVWKLNITVNQIPLTVFVYVDSIIAGPEAAFASAKIQLCLAGPIGTPAGAQLLTALFDVNGVFRNPTSAAPRVWRATFTPYTPGTPNPNPAGTTEGQALVPNSVSLKLASKSLRRGVVIISGRLLVDGKGFRGASIELFVGTKRVGKTKTKSNGRFTFRKRIKRKTRYRAVTTYVGDLPGCPATPLPTVPQGCKTATTSFIGVSNLVTAKRRR